MYFWSDISKFNREENCYEYIFVFMKWICFLLDVNECNDIIVIVC